MQQCSLFLNHSQIFKHKVAREGMIALALQFQLVVTTFVVPLGRGTVL